MIIYHLKLIEKNVQQKYVQQKNTPNKIAKIVVFFTNRYILFDFFFILKVHTHTKCKYSTLAEM